MKFQTTILLSILFCSCSFGNPTGGTSDSEGVSFQESGSTLTINAPDRSIISWQDFSIAEGETTQFVQPSSNAAVLNRVTSNTPSQIFGNLLANGNVYLMNPNGILVGASGVINTGGFLATTLDQWTSDFFENGELGLMGDSDAAVINLGSITATGDIFLIAREIDNQGTIHSTGGMVGLTAGKDVLLKESGEERIFIRPVGEGEINIEGSIEALDIEIKSRGNPYSIAINLEGQLTANKVNEVGGRVFLQTDNGGGVLIGAAGQMDAEEVIVNTTDLSLFDNPIITVDDISIDTGDIEISSANPIDVSVFTGGGSYVDLGLISIDSESNILGYSSFNISEGEIVNFVQPNGNVSVLNRITSITPSQILGSVSAGGSVYLVNPSGTIQPIVFRPLTFQPASDYLNTPLFSNIKSGKSVVQDLHGSILENNSRGTLLAKFSTQAEDDSRAIINLDK